MKRLIAVIAVMVLVTSVCYAKNSTTINKSGSRLAQAAAHKDAESGKIAKGKIDSLTVADPTKGTKSEIVIIDENSQKITVTLKATTTIYASDGKAITIDKLAKDTVVKVKYIVTKDGANDAISISVSK